MLITLQRVEKHTPFIWTFWFQPDRPVRFQAGQYFEVRLPHAGMDSRGDRRWLTISSAPHNPLLGVTVRFAPQYGSSYKTALQQLLLGATLYASDPIGDFVLPKNPGTPLVFVTAGIGSTPVHSMIQDMVYHHETRPIHMVHGVHAAQDLIYDDFFRTSGISYSTIVNKPDSTWKGAIGRLDADHVLSLTGKPDGKLFYFSGPENFIMELVYALHKKGVERGQVVLDYFPGYHPTA